MITLPIRFSQFDSRWCDHLLGFNSDPQYNIKNYGCLLCCMAMILKYYGKDINPDQLNDALKEKLAFEANTGIYDWGKLSSLYSDVSDSITKTPSALTDEQLNQIKSSIDAGKPVILEIDYNPKTVALNMHFVIAVGYNPNDENDFTIADPLGGVLHSLKDYLGWFKPSARNTIEAFTIIDGPLPVGGTDSTILVNADVFPQIVHGSDQWDKTIGKYMVGSDPKQVQFEDFDKVIGGIKSRATDAFNQLNGQKGDLAAVQGSVSVLNEKIANEEKQRQADQQMYLAQIAALKTSGTSIDSIGASYEARIVALQGQIRGLLEDKHNLSSENARLQVGSPTLSLIEKYFPTFLAWLQKIVK